LVEEAVKCQAIESEVFGLFDIRDYAITDCECG